MELKKYLDDSHYFSGKASDIIRHLGFVGIALGIAVFNLEEIELFRGDIAAWLLLAFGFTYFVWGVHRAIRHRRHEHWHEHGNQDGHSHYHSHTTISISIFN